MTKHQFLVTLEREVFEKMMYYSMKENVDTDKMVNDLFIRYFKEREKREGQK